jgi:predicted ATPase/DNA-binding SARP family transcriptional activator
VVRFEALGTVRVFDDDDQVREIGSRTQRTILASLIGHAGRAVSIDELCDAIWGDEPPRTAMSSMRSQVARLRQVAGDRIVSDSGAFRLVLRAGDAVDVAEFDAAVAAARPADSAAHGDIDAVAAQLRAALGAWRGRPFGDVGDVPTVRAEAARLELAHREAIELLARLDLAAGRHGEVIAAMETLVLEEPVRESAWELLIRALVGTGRSAEGVRAAGRARAVLSEAGLVAGEALRRAEQIALGVSTVGPGADDLVPARAPDPVSVRPPAPLTATIGRATEMELVAERFANGRLVTLVGPGGVGKTRLAIDVACSMADRFRRGAVVVDLSPVRTRADVSAVVVASLQLSTDRRGADEALGEAGGVDVLAVLDNCEHVIDEVAGAVREMLASGSDLRVLATSRGPLGIDGEHVVPIAPLDTNSADGAAVALFSERALMAAPDVVLDSALARRVVERLDGLPLAIEMAASRLRSMSLEELEHALSDNLATLSSRRRDIEARQRTMRSLLEWSDALLDDDERDVWLAMSVFASPVTLDAIVAVAGRADVEPIVERLVDQSLVMTVRPDTGSDLPTRYTLLEVVRAFTRERVSELGGADELSQRHARWVCALVEQIDDELRTEREPAAAARFAAVFEDVRRAHRWLVETDADGAVDLLVSMCLASRQSLRPELAQWAELTLDAIDAKHPRIADVRSVLAAGLACSGRLEQARDLGEVALEGVPTERATLALLDALGDVDIYEGRLGQAERTYRRGLAAAIAAGDPSYIALGRSALAITLAYQGRAREALRSLEGATSTSVSGEGWLAYARGESMLESEPALATVWLDRAVELGTASGNRYLAEVAMLSASSAIARVGDPVLAVDRFVTLLELFRDAGDDKHLLTTLRNVVPILVQLDRCFDAASLFGVVAEHPLVASFGPESDRLRAAADSCRRTLGERAFADAVDAGRRWDLDLALARTHEVLAAVRSGDLPPQAPATERDGRTPSSLARHDDDGRHVGRFVRSGDVWTLDFRGASAAVAHVKGLDDLAVLLAQPYTDVHALQLVGGADVHDAPGVLLDEEAKAAYRRRITELRDDIEHARQRGNVAKAQAAEDELDALIAELSAGAGLGGRPRATSSSHERARSAVTNRIRVAIRKVDGAHPELARHLANSVRTGTWCSYRPEHQVRWETTGGPGLTS